MSRNTLPLAVDRPLTSGDLIDFWHALDESLVAESARKRPSPGVTLTVARWATGISIASIVLTIGPLLRAVGGA